MDLERLRVLAGINEAANYKEPKATHKVKSGAGSSSTGEGSKDLKHKPEMSWTDPKGAKSGKYNEPKANHAVKAGGKTVHVKEMAQAIVESGDVEGTLAALVHALQEAGVEL